MSWDVFISHAFEDKENFVRPLAIALQSRGLRVWYDEFSLKLGDPLRESIEEGLTHARFGVVVLSPAFFRKKWSQLELSALVAKEGEGRKVILPVWHGVAYEDVRSHSLLLADRLAVSSVEGVEKVAELVEAACKALPKLDTYGSSARIADGDSVTIHLYRERRFGGDVPFKVHLDAKPVADLENGSEVVLTTEPAVHEIQLTYAVWESGSPAPAGGPRGGRVVNGSSPVHRREFRQGEWAFDCGYDPVPRPWYHPIVYGFRTGFLLRESTDPATPLFIRLRGFAPTVEDADSGA